MKIHKTREQEKNEKNEKTKEDEKEIEFKSKKEVIIKNGRDRDSRGVKE